MTFLLILIIFILVCIIIYFILSKKNIVNDWEETFPILAIEDNFIVGGNGELTIGFNLILPEIFSLSQENHLEANEEYIKFLGLLPTHTTVHKQDFFYEHIKKVDLEENSFIDKERNNHFSHRPVLCHYSNLYITFKNHANPKNTSSSSFLNLFSIPSQKNDLKIQDKISSLQPIIDNIINFTKNSTYIKTHIMDSAKLGNAVYDYFSCDYNNAAFNNLTNYEEKILPPLEANTELKIGNNFIKLISLIQESAQLSPCGINKTVIPNNSNLKINTQIPMLTSYVYPIGLGLPIEHILNTIITIKDKDELKLEFEQKKRNLNVLKTFSPEAAHQAQFLEDFQATLINQGYIPVLMSVNVIIKHPNLEYLKECSSLVNTGLTAMGSKGYTENFETANLFFNSAPGNGFNNYRSLLTVSNLAVCYLQKETHYYNDENGFVFVDRFGNPCILDIWNHKQLNSKNMIIIGGTGTGKSVLTNNLTVQLLNQQTHVTIIDVGHSYKQTCAITGGKYFDSSDTKNLSFNPFLLVNKNKNGSYDENFSESLLFISVLIFAIWKSKETDIITSEEQNLLNDILINFYDHINVNNITPNLIEFKNYLNYYEENILNHKNKNFINFASLNLSLEPFTTGVYSYFLNSKENIDIVNDKFIVFDLEAVLNNKMIFKLLCLIIVELTNQKSNQLSKGVRKALLIDEALDFLKDENMSKYISELYRKIRKKNGLVAIAQQSVGYFAGLPTLVQSSIIQNSEIKILLDHSKYKSSIKDIQSILSFTDKDIELLNSIQNGKEYREFLIKLGNKTLIYRNELSDHELASYETNPDAKFLIEKEYLRFGSQATAIYQYIENKTKKFLNN